MFRHFLSIRSRTPFNRSFFDRGRLLFLGGTGHVLTGDCRLVLESSIKCSRFSFAFLKIEFSKLWNPVSKFSSDNRESSILFLVLTDSSTELIVGASIFLVDCRVFCSSVQSLLRESKFHL